MKNFFLISALLFCFSLQSQIKTAPSKAAQKTATVQGKYSGATTQNLVQTLVHDDCVGKKFSIVFHLINDSLYSLTTPSLVANALATYSLTHFINLLNTTFSPICVSFENCKTVIIPNYTFNEWRASTTGTNVINNWYTENVINVYLPEDIIPIFPDPPEFSYTFSVPPAPQGTFVPVDAIVIARTALRFSPLLANAGGFSGSNLLHVFGHYFGLPHTYSEKNPNTIPNPPPPLNATPPIITLEYVDHVNIQNCLDHGDGFCDTEADPYGAWPTTTLYPTATVPSCEASNGLKDGHGDFYIAPTDNFMSHYGCRCKFSQQQYSFMAEIIRTRRLYLH